MKGILIFLLLLSFLVNVDSKCNPNEVLDEQTQKCVKFCEIGEAFDQETSSCVININCPEGQRFINETSSCEKIPTFDQDAYKRADDPDKNPENNKKNITCKDGKLIVGNCICPKGKKLINEECVDEPKFKICKNGILSKGKCLCIKGFKLQGDNECIPIKKCFGGFIDNGKCKCPLKKILKDDKCVVKECIGGDITLQGECKCPPGKKEQFGRCVNKCPPGMHFYFFQHKCVRISTCPPGMTYKDGKCTYDICPAGMILENGKCVNLVKCPSGTRRNGKFCIPTRVKPEICSPGMILKNGTCVDCPTGTRKIGNQCYRIPKPKTCPSGTRKIGNQCYRIPKPKTCPTGTRKIGKKCIPIRFKPKACSPEMVLKNGTCVKLN